MSGWRLVTAALLVAVLLSACAAPSSPGVKTHWLRVADGSGDLPTLNPHLFSGSTLGLIAYLSMAYLFRYDANSQLVPELATEMPTQGNGGISADGRTIIFHLRRGVRWSDGAPFSAADVVFSTNVVLNPANNEVSRAGWDLIQSVEQRDAYTVVFHMRRPFALFEPVFFGAGDASPCILPVHLLGKEPVINRLPYNAKPIGIGPFRVVNWRRGEGVELEANPYYWRGPPKLRRITFRFVPSRDTLFELMQARDIDLWPMVPPPYIDRAQAITALRTVVLPGSLWAHLDFNLARPMVSDVRVRRAIRLAIDRREIVDKIVHGNGIMQEAIVSPIVAVVPTDLPLVPFDPISARQLLDRAGYRVGSDGVREKNGKRLSLTFVYYSGVSTMDDMLELIRQELREVGIEIETRRYPPAQLFAGYRDNGIIDRGNWDMTTFSYGSDPNGSLQSELACDRMPPDGENSIRYCNPRVDDWLRRFNTTFDEAKRRELMAKIERQLVSDVPEFTLYVWREGYTYSPRLEGYHPGPYAPYGDAMNLDI